MPRLVKSAFTCTLVCAALLAQSFGQNFIRRAAASAAETPRRAGATRTTPDARPNAGTHTPQAAADFGPLPLTFEVNRGQAAPGVEYLTRGAGYTLMLTRAGALLSLKDVGSEGARGETTREATLRMSFPGARPSARSAGLGLSETKSNYLRGGDPRRWLKGVENYASVAYAGLYEGVDLVFHGSEARPEYDFRVAAGADARPIRVRFDGAQGVRLDRDGTLVLLTRAGEVRQPAPFAYQEDGAGQRTRVACEYTMGGPGEVGFRLGAYDRARPLVIDPVLVYSTYLGGGVSANSLAVDAAGNAFVAGTDSTGDVLVLKLNPTGTGLVYSTHVGGANQDTGQGIALDPDGNAYVTGTTLSPNFPTSSDAFDKTCGSTGTCSVNPPGLEPDAFVFKLNAAGSALVYSTFLGGSGSEPIPGQVNFPNFPRMSIALDSGRNAYVAGSTTSMDFPTTPGAFSTTPESGFVSKLNPTGTALVYSTYFPGAMPEAIAVDAGGNAYFTGLTGTGGSQTPTLPVVNAYQPTLGGAFTFDAFAAKLNAAGTALVFSTFLGGKEGTNDTPRGGDDYGNGIGFDSGGNVYVSGVTRSGCFPASDPYVAPTTCTSGVGPKEFLVKLTPGGDHLLFSKKLNALVAEGGELKVSAAGVSTVAWTCLRGVSFFDVCVDRVSSSGTTLFTTAFGGTSREFLWGVFADNAAGVYVAGTTSSSDYPVTPGALGQTKGSPDDSFVTKLSTAAPEVQFERTTLADTSAKYFVAESGGKVTVRVERTGDLASAFAVDYATADSSARSTSDYTAAAGTLHFAPFETSKTIDVLITNDVYGPEGAETFTVTLSNPTDGAQLGAYSTATVSITDDDSVNGQNPVALSSFDANFFVRQHYADFLNREPDAAGLAFWTEQLTSCGNDLACLDVKRINVSAAFFLSIESQETGYLVYRTYKVAYGDASSPGVAGTVPVVRLNEFLPDTRRIGEGVIVGQGAWASQLDANKSAYLLEFVQRQRFLTAFPLSMTATQFVDTLDQNAGGVLSASERTSLINELTPSPSDSALRADVLRKVAEDTDIKQRELNRAFVLMEYFGYLRRNPDDPPEPTLNYAGWKFWLDKLNAFNGNYVAAEMVKAFLNSEEYRRRFGP